MLNFGCNVEKIVLGPIPCTGPLQQGVPKAASRPFRFLFRFVRTMVRMSQEPLAQIAHNSLNERRRPAASRRASACRGLIGPVWILLKEWPRQRDERGIEPLANRRVCGRLQDVSSHLDHCVQFVPGAPYSVTGRYNGRLLSSSWQILKDQQYRK